MSHEAIEQQRKPMQKRQKEYNTDSDSDHPTADNDERDALDNLMFLRAVTTRSERMVRVIYWE